MDMQSILDTLAALEQNNNREWYHANKQPLREASLAFEELLQELLLQIRAFDSTIPPLEVRELTFKLVRDTRFSHDKSPYNPAFRAHIAAKGKLPIPVGYFVMIRPGGRSFLGGGLFADMFTSATAMIRDAIAANGDEWERIISDPSFTERFTVGGTALKRVPRGYDPGHPQAQFLKQKSWYLEYPVADAKLLEADFPAFAAEVFKEMMPFNAFLNRALEGFQMPARP